MLTISISKNRQLNWLAHPDWLRLTSWIGVGVFGVVFWSQMIQLTL